jgi:uncharacterized membrane protein YGL010W
MVRFEIAGMALTAGHVFGLLVLAYYFALDVGLAIAMLLAVGALMLAAQAVAGMSTSTAWAVFGATFVGGWIIQLVGHIFEGRRPALVDNLWQIFVAPLFLMVEALAPLGIKRDALHRAEALASAGAPVSDGHSADLARRD